MIAELPMYDLPECRVATDTLWSGIARAMRREGITDVPERLTRGSASGETGKRPDQFLSQVCGTNLTGASRQHFTYLATPCFSAPGCHQHQYRSLFVVHSSSSATSLHDLRGKRCVINSRSSHSGCNALRATFAPLAVDGRFFGSVTVSGGHTLSLTLIAVGQADVAAIDCITYALLARVRPESVGNIRILAQSVVAPAGPYVTRRNQSGEYVERLRTGLFQAMIDPELESARADLFLSGIKVLPVVEYNQIAQIKDKSVDFGYRDFDPHVGCL